MIDTTRSEPTACAIHGRLELTPPEGGKPVCDFCAVVAARDKEWVKDLGIDPRDGSWIWSDKDENGKVRLFDPMKVIREVIKIKERDAVAAEREANLNKIEEIDCRCGFSDEMKCERCHVIAAIVGGGDE